MKNILTLEDFSNEPKLDEASVQIAGRDKPSGAKVLAMVIVDDLVKKKYLNPFVRNILIDDVQKIIMDSTF
jgi:hypothetical protein